MLLVHSHNYSSASVLFNFNACDYTNLLKSSIQSLSFAGELNTIVNMALNPVIDRASFLPTQFTDTIKSTIVSTAEGKINEVKSTVISQINALAGGCARRRLGAMELNEDGSQRMLELDMTFNNLAGLIQTQVSNVVSFVSLYMLPIISRVCSSHQISIFL